jgi:hypothetical protein
MLRDDDKLERAKPEVTGLESYRRLIMLQKQMIELSQQHEQAKRERDVLREKVAREVADHLLARRSLRHRWRGKLVKFLKRWRLSKIANPFRFTGRIRTTPSPSN